MIIIPTLNESKSIALTIQDVKKHCQEEVVIIDSYSTDGTKKIALDLGCKVIDAPRGGKGKAIRYALPLLKSDKIIMIDGDYTYPAKHIPQALESLENFDVVIGYRKWKEQGSMTFTNKVGNKGLSLIASILYGIEVKDLCTGFWGFKGSVLQNFKLSETKFQLEADLLFNSSANNAKIAQIPIEYRARRDSKSKLKISDGFSIASFLLMKRLS